MILTHTKLMRLKIGVMTLALAVIAGPHFAQAQDESSQEDRRAAFDACLTELGIEKPEQGQRPQAPDEEVRTKLDACMKEKGFEPPKHRLGEGGRRHHGGPRQGGESSGSGVQ